VTLAKTKDGKFVINKEYLHATSKVLLSYPGGFLSDDEDPISGAKRELLEETGYAGERFVLSGFCYPFPGLCNQRLYIVSSESVSKVATPQLEISEVIETVLMSKEELHEFIQAGEPVDGILCAALFFVTQE
jgi:ADP-ribose pyrophosphatase